ncbi:MAG: 1-phosphofructokinase [Candidatus Izemoplasmataceae bacterium]
MIYTCTMNPAIDYRMEFNDVVLGELNRTTYNKFSAGGKGVNVSIVLSNLGSKTIALGFMGGFTGVFLEDYLLNTYQLPSKFTKIKDTTRINVKLSENSRETELNAKAPNVTKEEFDQLLSSLRNLAKDDVLVLAGSTVKLEEKPYDVIAKLCYDQHVPFVLDVEKEAMISALKYQPLLIKPNLFELETIFNVSIKDGETLIKYAKELLKKGAQNIIVSLGKDGSYFINKEIVYRALPIKGNAKNPVGAGDSMVAGFLHEYEQSSDLKEAYITAVAAGTASAFSYDLATKEEIDKVRKKIEIIEVRE